MTQYTDESARASNCIWIERHPSPRFKFMDVFVEHYRTAAAFSLLLANIMT